MLLAAIIISLMGIANTLSLSINERTREIGLSRAVGMLRGQLRAMVRWEGALIALFGTIGGLVLGVIGSWAIVRSTGAAGLVFKLPIGSLLVYLVIGGLFGVLSALLPANRAARLNVLSAIAQE
jgi:putative ABC transport system permease protein